MMLKVPRIILAHNENGSERKDRNICQTETVSEPLHALKIIENAKVVYVKSIAVNHISNCT